VTGSASAGFTLLGAAPAAVGNNNQQQTEVFAWNEQQGVLLGANLVTDLGGPILAGTLVDSHGIVFDPANSASTDMTVTFSGRILGVQILTASLVATDALFGSPGTTYNSPSARGLETNELGTVSFAGNVLTVSRWTASTPGDNIRVLTAAVPEPATWAMMIAGFGLVGAAARRRRALAA
jgi:hypothetical protein